MHPQAIGLTPFQRSFKKCPSCCSVSCGVVTLKRFNNPAARQAHNSPWHVPMPTRVRRRKSSKLLTVNELTA